MHDIPPGALTPFVFSDPAGKRWPRLRLALLILGVLAFYTNGDPYSYASLEEHASLITHLCPEWITVVNGLGDISIDPDIRLPKFCTSKGIKLMPLLTNLLGDTWQPEAVENLAHGPPDRQESFFAKVIGAL